MIYQSFNSHSYFSIYSDYLSASFFVTSCTWTETVPALIFSHQNWYLHVWNALPVSCSMYLHTIRELACALIIPSQHKRLPIDIVNENYPVPKASRPKVQDAEFSWNKREFELQHDTLCWFCKHCWGCLYFKLISIEYNYYSRPATGSDMKVLGANNSIIVTVMLKFQGQNKKTKMVTFQIESFFEWYFLIL